MLCHIVIGFVGGLFFLGTTATKHPDRPGTPLKTEVLHFLSTSPFAKP